MAGETIETLALLHFDGDIKDEIGNQWQAIGTGYSFTDEKPGFLGSSCIKMDARTTLECTSPNFAFGLADFTIDYRIWRVKYVGLSSFKGYDGITIGATESFIGSGRNNWIYTAYKASINKSIPLGEWTHIAYVRQGDNGYFFINGELKATDTGIGQYNLTCDTFVLNSKYVGQQYDTTEAYYDEVRISRGARWTSDFTPPGSGTDPDPDNYTITEKYELEDSTSLQNAVDRTVALGDGYAATAPFIDGYDCIGFIIDGGNLQPGTTATIASVTHNYEVVFIYKIKQQGGNDSGVPSGMVMYFTDSVAPDGWLKCDGSSISRTDYPKLFNVVGTKFGAGDGYTTFNLPDLRAQFIRGFDDGKGVDEGRSFGSYQPGSLLMNDSDSVTNTPDLVSLDARYNPTETLSHDKVENLSEYPNLRHYIKQPDSTCVAMEDAVEAVSGFLGVARPKNIALLPCIKY